MNDGKYFPAGLSQAYFKGVDIYFETIGSSVFRSVVPQINRRGRIYLSLIFVYNTITASSVLNLFPALTRLDPDLYRGLRRHRSIARVSQRHGESRYVMPMSSYAKTGSKS